MDYSTLYETLRGKLNIHAKIKLPIMGKGGKMWFNNVTYEGIFYRDMVVTPDGQVKFYKTSHLLSNSVGVFQ